jgi:hypothetical protein
MIARGPYRDWLGNTALWGTVPGWLLSLVFHAVMFVTMLTLTQLPSCRGDYSGEGGTGFREIGLKARDDGSDGGGGQSGPADSNEVAAATASDVSAVADTPRPSISDQPPVPLSLPELGEAPSVLGIGPPPLAGVGGAPAASSAGSVGGTGKGTGGGSPGSRGGGAGQGHGTGTGTGQTSLFGVNDSGKTFVYLIDRSSSMEDYGALRAAKSELLSSLQRLTEVQQFQVIFYSTEPFPLATREARFKMFFGTDAQRQLVSEQIRSVPAEGGTRHMEAIMEAMKFNADVIFLLTDGATPGLKKADLDSIKARNRSGTRIHCIEFGTGPQPVTPDGAPIGNFLMKLSQQNDGQYTYRDVKQFAAAAKSP